LFNDPAADALAGGEGFKWLERFADPRTPPGTANPYFAIRTRFFDEFLLKTSHDAGVKQVVLLAAGMDTRAFSLPWPVKTRLYEIDSVEVLARKQSVLDRMGLKPACERHVVCADL